MTGPLHPDDVINPQNPQTRYKYSPVHQDVAVCCVPNAGRIYPYYVKSMWMRSAEGLTAMLYGAGELHTEVNGTTVHIHEATNYPFDLNITFTVKVSQPIEFELSFRKPAWAVGVVVETDSRWHEENGLITIRKTWHSGEQVILRFQAAVKTETFHDDEFFLSHGPLLFALPLNGQAKEGKSHPLEGFRDLYYFPDNSNRTVINGRENFTLERQPFNPEHPFDASVALVESMPADTNRDPIRLIPIGGTILRKVTFRRE